MSEGGELPDWSMLVSRLVNPTKVVIIEALRHIGQPLSASDLAKVLDGELGVSHLSYHLKTLTTAKVLKRVRQRQVRGAIEKFYFFTPQK
jgi:DNA-binding transcriptional ArsR family regulator